MKKKFVAFLLISAILAACGDDGSSNSSEQNIEKKEKLESSSSVIVRSSSVKSKKEKSSSSTIRSSSSVSSSSVSRSSSSTKLSSSSVNSSSSISAKNYLDSLNAYIVPVVKAGTYDCDKHRCFDDSYLNPDVEYGEILDVRDDQVYKTVKIGDQIWMAQNLNFEVDSSFCLYNIQPSCELYGRFYRWEAAMKVVYGKKFSFFGNHQGVCPGGWHIPTNAEWIDLMKNYDKNFEESETMSEFVFNGTFGTLLSSQTWKKTALAEGLELENTSGFSIVASGSRVDDESFTAENLIAKFWSATWPESGIMAPYEIYFSIIDSNTQAVLTNGLRNTESRSIRCVQD